jgi:hypothetical protein
MIKTRSQNLLLIACFVLVIIAPLSKQLASEANTVSVLEKRNLATWIPYADADSLNNYFQGISDYVRDHFGFRETLIGLNARIKLFFGESPVDSVLKGRDGWHFLKTYDPLLMSKTDKPQIEAALQSRARFVYRRFQSLAEKNVGYLYFVAPNKMTIYPENLPRLYGFMDHQASYQVFQNSLPSADSYYLNMVTWLIDNKSIKSKSELYFRTDSHWNDLGASVAYTALADKARTILPNLIIEPGHHAFVNEPYLESDLVNLMGITSRARATAPTTTFPQCAQRNNIKAYLPMINVIRCSKNTTVAVLIGDSFMTKIYPYFAESVGALYIVNKGISQTALLDLVDRVKPDIIFEETVQRDLAKQLAELN